jgi:hypothetical protein
MTKAIAIGVLLLAGTMNGQTKPKEVECHCRPYSTCAIPQRATPDECRRAGGEPVEAVKLLKIDVPPITEQYGNVGTEFCDRGQCSFVEGAGDAMGNPPKRRTRLTCANKRRFLMTAEDGSKHCILLLPAPTGGTR